MLSYWFFISPYAIMMSGDICLIAKAWKLSKGIRKRSKMRRGCKMLE
ncbi:hypothetical protein M140_1252 [Bacteroides fragilis str. S38L3]|nr:hypothetical protein M140_1252 [Bacteroides fragilis str. S38L3]